MPYANTGSVEVAYSSENGTMCATLRWAADASGNAIKTLPHYWAGEILRVESESTGVGTGSHSLAIYDPLDADALAGCCASLSDTAASVKAIYDVTVANFPMWIMARPVVVLSGCDASDYGVTRVYFRGTIGEHATVDGGGGADAQHWKTSVGEYCRYEWLWTSGAAGLAQSAPLPIIGQVGRLVTLPGTAAPTTLYDVGLYGADGAYSVDALSGLGADRSATLTESKSIYATGVGVGYQRVRLDGRYRLKVSNAGVAKSGRAALYVRTGDAQDIVPIQGIVHHLCIPIVSSPLQNSVWSNMPAAETEFPGTTNGRVAADLAAGGFTQFRLIANQSTAGAASCYFTGQYSLNSGGAWSNLEASAGTTGRLDVGTGTGLKVGVWATLDSSAKADVWLRLTGTGGDGVVDPAWRQILIEFR